MESALKNNPRSPGFRLDTFIPKNATFPAFSTRWLLKVTDWETWDWRIKYIFIAPVWLWFCLRARSLWFFTASNPTLTFGGFEGESKKEMYAQLPPGSYPASIYVGPHLSFSELEKLLRMHAFSFPVAVKPEVGKMGLMFRRINSLEELKLYHEMLPFDYIIQEFIDYPTEVSVFYYRMPDSPKGTISAFIRKDFLEVTGDGECTLWELIRKYPRVQFRLAEMKRKHKAKLSHIIPAGERFCLSPALNLSRGGKLVSLEHEKDEKLLKVFDDLSHYSGNFFYGRYDIKCRSVEDLKEGKNFCILEYNGSGAEPHHVYGNGYSLFQACRILVAHWQVLFQISRVNYKKGILYWDLTRGWHFLKRASRHIRSLKQLDEETAIS